MATTTDSNNQAGALADSLSTAFMVMLETLTPEERPVFILREAFDYNYNEIVSAGVPISVVTFNVIAGQIAGIYIVGNPQKLRHLNHP